MSRFPKVTETFILREILAVEQQGLTVELYPLVREHEPVVHPEAVPLVARAHYLPFLSVAIVAATSGTCAGTPAPFWGRWAPWSGATWGSPNFLSVASASSRRSPTPPGSWRPTGSTTSTATSPPTRRWPGFVIHRLTGIPFSFTAHGSDLHVDRHMLVAKVAEAAFVVPISAFNAEVIAEECGAAVRDKLVVVHCGVDPRCSPTRARRDAVSGPFTVVCVGHPARGQGPGAPRRGLPPLWPRRRRLRLPVRRERARTRRRCGRRIAAAGLERTGASSRAGSRSPRSRSSSRAPTCSWRPASRPAQGKREGIPVVLMEAHEQRRAVVASELSGIPELVEDGAQRVCWSRRGDPAALALGPAPARTTTRTCAARLGPAGRQKVEREFDVHASAGRLAALRRAATTVAATGAPRQALELTAAPSGRRCATIAYTYALFPLLVLARAALRPRPHARGRRHPVRQRRHRRPQRGGGHRREARERPRARLPPRPPGGGRRVRRLRRRHRRVVRRFADRGVRLLSLPRCGKAAALNAAVARRRRARSSSSPTPTASTRPTRSRALVRPFADPVVGGVAGDQRYRESAGDGRHRRRRAAATGTSTGCSRRPRAGRATSSRPPGAIYAVRREPLPPGRPTA